jgi:hypothetical protein
MVRRATTRLIAADPERKNRAMFIEKDAVIPDGVLVSDDRFYDDSEPVGEMDDVPDWYDSSTIDSVLTGVGFDLDRARFALGEELADSGKGRSGVVEALEELLD